MCMNFWLHISECISVPEQALLAIFIYIHVLLDYSYSSSLDDFFGAIIVVFSFFVMIFFGYLLAFRVVFFYRLF